MRLVAGLKPVFAHGLGGKLHIGVDVEFALLVLAIKRVIALGKFFGIGPTHAGGVLAPRVVRIQGQEGVVQIKQANRFQTHLSSKLLHHVAHQGHGDGAFGLQGKAIDLVQPMHQAGQIAAEAVEQIVHHLIAQKQTPGIRMLAQH